MNGVKFKRGQSPGEYLVEYHGRLALTVEAPIAPRRLWHCYGPNDECQFSCGNTRDLAVGRGLGRVLTILGDSSERWSVWSERLRDRIEERRQQATRARRGV